MRFPLIVSVLLLVIFNPVTAQEQPATLSLTTSTTTLQTRQNYEITIRLDGSPDFWLAALEISYDPSKLYVIGTKAGSPVRPGELFPDVGSVTALNAVQNSSVIFTISRAGEVAPASGSGVIGSFHVYPLASGTTQLSFLHGELRRLNAAQNGTDPLPFTPIQLGLTISGDPVEPPTEATATPAPTDTPDAGVAAQPTFRIEATLANMTAVPTAGSTAVAPATDQPLFLVLAVVIMMVGAVGFVVVLIWWRRSRR